MEKYECLMALLLIGGPLVLWTRSASYGAGYRDGKRYGGNHNEPPPPPPVPGERKKMEEENDGDND